ncbi:hypothetical protein DFH11DRAFT_1503552 [Phellopilus nigrolimitatus]|nr:hypothetical protein DFH11DRAFT_1503552 [Phellopilus nigrolimitatus]
MNGFTQGTDGGPPSTQAYKRAVYKQPPRHFSVQVLAPQKHGNAFSYGMRITPLHDASDRHSTISRTSDNSNGSSSSGSGSSSQAGSTLDSSSTAPLKSEYEVWRRWEDCLYFQDILDVQYGIMSREKRARLNAGKGVKKNGMYEHEDPLRRLHRAASFESLPPGPDPTMIAKDLRGVLPRLAKKGTLFKASKETIEHRGAEFKNLIEALLREEEDVPTLITELRQLRVVRDFFGFWRRDYDRLEKERPKSKDGDRASIRSRPSSRSSSSTTFAGGSSMFASGGMYFSASSLSLQTPPPHGMPPKSPRRPPIMQGGKGAMLPGSPTASEPGPDRNTQAPRPRAQTLEGTMGVSTSNLGPSISRSGTPGTPGSPPFNGSQSIVAKPLASAPAAISFASAIGGLREDDGGYNSDSTSVADSITSSHALPSPVGSPHAMRTPRSPYSPSNARFNNAAIAGAAEAKGKGNTVDMDMGDPIIVSLEAGENLPFDEEAHMLILREHERFIPRGMDPFHETDMRLGSGRGLQDLTIKEEDEREDGQDPRDSQYDHLYSDYQYSESSVDHESGDGVFSEEEMLPRAIPRALRTEGAPDAGSNRNCMFFRPPSSSTEDTVSSADGLSAVHVEHPRNHLFRSRSHASVSSTRSAAHADALNVLTGEHSPSMRSSRPASAMLLSPPSTSVRSSMRTSGPGSGSGSGSASGSPGFGPTRSSIDTQRSSTVRPYSYQSSNASCADLECRLSSSPMVMHTPLFEEYEHDHDNWSRSHDTNGREHSGLRHYVRDSVSSVRTFMTDCSANAIIRAPYEKRAFSPPPTSSSSSTTLRQFHLPWTSSRPSSPSLPVSARNSVLTVDDTFSVPPSVSETSSPTTPSSYSPSIVASLADDTSGATVLIKVVCGQHIVAFRVDRNSELADLRDKLHHKLVDQQGVELAEHFALAYVPPGPGRVQELKTGSGRARSNSMSSIGPVDPSSLRILFSQRDWEDAVNSCAVGTKLTLHVLNG